MTAGSPLRILWVEDLEDDVNLAARELKKAGLQFEWRRVETSEEFEKGLKDLNPDVIISDHSLPQFNSVEAFKIYQQAGGTIPFILLTGNVSEEFAVSVLKLGIDDYILKSNMGRLPSAILSALHVRQLEKARHQREEDTRAQNLRLEEEVRIRTSELVAEKNFTDAIIRNMPGICYVIEGEQLIRWNEDLETATGYSSNEIRHLDFLELFTDREMAKHVHKETLAIGNSRYELDIVTKVGQRIPYYFTSLVADIGTKKVIVVSGVDISDLKNTQETLRLHDERMELAFSTSGNAWWDWDIVTGNVDSHPNRYLTLGYSFEDTTPRQEWWISLLHPEDLEMAKREAMECLTGQRDLYDIECRLKSKQGDWKWFRVVGKVVTTDHQGRPIRMIGTADNVSRNKLIEKELLEAKYAAEAANRTKSQFLANMSHEIRTPLNAIIGLSHLAMKTELTPKQLDYLMKIHSSSESLLGIINDILDFSKIEAGKLSLVEESFDLEEIFHKVGNVIAYKANAKGLEIAFGIDNNVPTYLIGDPGRLEQVLVNLCTNAVKFTDHGEVIVSVHYLGESDNSLKLRFDVSDTGTGMDDIQLARLFQPFTQANDTISRKYGGTGLGLSIIKRLVEMMNGDVWVESELGKGSEFHFTAEFKRQKHQIRIPKPRVNLRNRKVLLVDDSAAAREILKGVLESFCMQVVAVNSGSQAIHCLKNSYFDPVDVVLMDWRMPEMDGLSAARIIRSDPQLAHVHIIMMSNGYASDELYKEVENLRLQGILIKPVRNSKLYDLLMEVVQNGKSTDPVSDQDEKSAIVNVNSGNILLVEDNEINQQVARELLEGFGFSVEIASNGKVAVERVMQSGTPSRYVAVLMDLQMPVMGGRAATTEIRKISAYSTLPIIALSADAVTSVREECLEIGMNDFITKPINPYSMLETIRKWIQPATPPVDDIPTRIDNEPLTLTLEGIDVADGLSHVAGNRKLFHDLLNQFALNHNSFVTDLEWCMANDWEKARMMTHTIKGLSGNLGMTQLHEQSKVLEAAINDPENRPTTVPPVFAEEFFRILTSIKSVLQRGKVDPSPSSPEQFLQSLLELEKLLLTSNPDAAVKVNSIGSVGVYATQVELLTKAVVNYDFEQGLSLLRELKSQLEERLQHSQ